MALHRIHGGLHWWDNVLPPQVPSSCCAVGEEIYAYCLARLTARWRCLPVQIPLLTAYRVVFGAPGVGFLPLRAVSHHVLIRSDVAGIAMTWDRPAWTPGINSHIIGVNNTSVAKALHMWCA